VAGDDLPPLLPSDIRHQTVMRAVMAELQEPGFVLRGGTAILFTRNGPRHSLDLDLDIDRDAAFPLKRIERGITNAGMKPISYNPGNGNVIYSDPSDSSLTSLKVDFVVQPIDRSKVETVNGIRTYTIDAIFDQKLDALAERIAPRDLFDVKFLLETHSFSPEQLAKAVAALDSVSDRLPDFERRYSQDPVFSFNPALAEQHWLQAASAIENQQFAPTTALRPLAPALRSPLIPPSATPNPTAADVLAQTLKDPTLKLLRSELDAVAKRALVQPEKLASLLDAIGTKPSTAKQDSLALAGQVKNLPASISPVNSENANQLPRLAFNIADYGQTLQQTFQHLTFTIDSRSLRQAQAIPAPSDRLAATLSQPLTDRVKILRTDPEQRAEFIVITDAIATRFPLHGTDTIDMALAELPSDNAAEARQLLVTIQDTAKALQAPQQTQSINLTR
jgi:hypothetical protein